MIGFKANIYFPINKDNVTDYKNYQDFAGMNERREEYIIGGNMPTLKEKIF